MHDMHVDLSPHLNQIRDCGMRRLLVLSGGAAWQRMQIESLIAQSEGDWLWVSETEPDIQGVQYQKPSGIHRLLGTALRHAVIDVNSGFHAEAFAVVSGLLAAGSLLVLQVPEWDGWSSLPDEDSLRWSDCSESVATPHFIERFRRCCREDADVMLWRQSEAFTPLCCQALIAG